ncbi:MAG: M50 family metallopeptidase [Terriglobales bacterium]|jgi:hypothetical protein
MVLIIAKAVDEQASRNSNSGLGILVFLAALSVAVLIHELGHLAAGWALGFRFNLISVGPLALHLEHGKLKISLLREMTALGYAGMHIDRLVRLRRRVLFYAAAGPVANLATVPAAVMFANHTSFAPAHPWSISFAAQLAMISILLSLVNLIPRPLGSGSFTDGSRIAMLLRDLQPTRRLLSLCAVGAQYQNGIRPQNWKQTWLKAGSSVADESADDFCGNWLGYVSANARKDDRLAGSHLERCLKLSRLHTQTVRDIAAQEAAIFAAWFRRDPLLADKWLAQVKRPKPIQRLARIRIDIAIFCARADFNEALQAWDEGLTRIKMLPQTPVQQTLREGWLEWRAQILERQKQTVTAPTADQS